MYYSTTNKTQVVATFIKPNPSVRITCHPVMFGRPKWREIVVMPLYLPMQVETWVQSLRQEDPLEEGTVTHSSVLAWRISWTEEPGRLQPRGSHRVGHDRSDLALELPGK